MAVGRSFFRSNSSGIFPKRTEVYWLLIFHLSLCSSDMKDLPGKSQPSKSLSTQLLCLFDQPSPFQLLFGDIVCFGQIDRGANQLEQCSCSEWDGWDSIHQLEICDWEWHSCIPWVCHSDGSEPAGSYGSLLEEGPHLDLLPHCWLYLQRSLHGDLSILWTTPLCLII